LNYDVRPSDGIAIALRMNAPIYINQTLLMTEGKKVC
jgi:bifunctional DNase/RNase